MELKPEVHELVDINRNMKLQTSDTNFKLEVENEISF